MEACKGAQSEKSLQDSHRGPGPWCAQFQPGDFSGELSADLETRYGGAIVGNSNPPGYNAVVLRSVKCPVFVQAKGSIGRMRVWEETQPE